MCVCVCWPCECFLASLSHNQCLTGASFLWANSDGHLDPQRLGGLFQKLKALHSQFHFLFSLLWAVWQCSWLVTAALSMQIHLLGQAYMYLDCERKPERTRTNTGGGACNPHLHQAWESNPQPSCCKTTVLTTASLCRPMCELIL